MSHYPPIADAIAEPLPAIDDAFDRVNAFMSEHMAADEEVGDPVDGLRDFAWVDLDGRTVALSAADIIALLKAVDDAYPLRHRIGTQH
jgi:hypothetical protein